MAGKFEKAYKKRFGDDKKKDGDRPMPPWMEERMKKAHGEDDKKDDKKEKLSSKGRELYKSRKK